MIYIPTDGQVGYYDANGNLQGGKDFRFTSKDDMTRFMEFVHQDDYLSDHQGEYAEAYSGYNPWVHRVDFSYKHDFKVCLGKTTNTLQLSLDVKNVLNFFNSSWGVAKYMNPAITGTNYDAKVLKYEGVDAEGYATFSTPKAVSGSTEIWQPYHSAGQCWYASVGAKYIFEGKRDADCDCDNGLKSIVKDNSEIERLNSEVNRLRAQLDSQTR